MIRIQKRTLLWSSLFAIAIAVLITLLVLIGLGYLALPASPPKQVTISEVEWTIVQGTTSHGIGWFGPSPFYYGENAGFPRTEPTGGTFNLPWSPQNFDTVSHNVCAVTIGNSGFSIGSPHPALPNTVPPGDDGGQFEFPINVPGSASGNYTLQLTINAISC